MLNLKLRGAHDAMALLKKDHDKVKDLFDRFDNEESDWKKIVQEACKELKLHAAVEEELFYPALRKVAEDEDGLLDEADEEHHAAKILIAELELMKGDEENYCAKFEVLAENVRHHIKEEERELFPLARRTDIDFEELGRRMAARKRELAASGVPSAREADMVSMYGVAPESPARAAVKNIDPPMTEGRSRARKH